MDNTCPECNGSGFQKEQPVIPAWSEHGDLGNEPCYFCSGLGYLEDDPGYEAFCQEENEL